MIIKRIWWIKTRELRTKAASMIQKNFRLFRRWNVIPKLMRSRKNNSAEIIQKYLKGYIVSRRLYHQIQQNKIDQNYNFFSDLRHRLEQSAAKTIKLYYIRYKIKKVERQQAEL